MTKILNIIFISSFLFTIAFPTLSMFSLVNANKSYYENRNLAQFPDLTKTRLKILSDELQHFYNDNFGFRNIMMQVRNQIRERFFVNGNTYVFQGKKGLYFLDPFRPRDPRVDYKTVFFTKGELNIIKNELEKEDAWFKQRTIPYMLVIAPDKEGVYPEYYPFPNNILTNFRLDQLQDYLDKNSSFRLVDLRKPLREAKSEEILLYYNGDLHWNQYGAFIAYQEIMRRLHLINPNAYAPKSEDFDIQTKASEVITGDLARIGQLSQLPYEVAIRFFSKSEFSDRKKLKKVFIYGDSFSKHIVEGETEGLASLLPFSFENVYSEDYITDKQRSQNALSPLDYDLIDEEKPDLVIREINQRNLRLLLGPKYSTF